MTSHFQREPVDFQPNMTPFEYFKRFTTTDDEDIFDELVDETNRYAATALHARRRVTPHKKIYNRFHFMERIQCKYIRIN
jgi:hypothetical protein